MVITLFILILYQLGVMPFQTSYVFSELEISSRLKFYLISHLSNAVFENKFPKYFDVY